MKSLVVELEDEVLEKLERAVPDQPKQQSEFIAMAIRKALWDMEERQTAEAYARQPDPIDQAYIDVDAWEA